MSKGAELQSKMIPTKKKIYIHKKKKKRKNLVTCRKAPSYCCSLTVKCLCRVQGSGCRVQGLGLRPYPLIHTHTHKHTHTHTHTHQWPPQTRQKTNKETAREREREKKSSSVVVFSQPRPEQRAISFGPYLSRLLGWV